MCIVYKNFTPFVSFKISQAWDGGLQNCINAKLKYTSLDAILDFLLKFSYSLIKFNHVVALMNVEKLYCLIG